jgi:predicted enzyme related to lactoylglutathione lyase
MMTDQPPPQQRIPPTSCTFLHQSVSFEAHNIRMFERYTEKARRTIFFARYEASQFGSPYIEAEFILLGMLRDDPSLSMRFFRSRTTPESLRKEIEQHRTFGEKFNTSVDIPLSNESKHVLAYAAEEAERLGHPFISTEHLLLGILREQNSFASQLLQQHGINVGEVRTDIAARPLRDPGVPAQRTLSTLGSFELVLKVTNLDASIDFYTKFGFTPAGDRGPGTALLANDNCLLRLDQNSPADHLLSFVSGDIIPTVSRLQSAGLKFDEPPRTKPDGSTTALLRDPDGNVISLFSRPRFAPPPPPM